ncbi:MAG: hydroxymethylbilane synthase [Phaeodactylibacter sp.]|nr:hydroxymethylbilane synthase [Phaeodactylibacter sp.]
MSNKIRIGTRGSKLALWQAHFTQDRLAEEGIESELIIIKTKGDQIQHLSFDKMEGKGFFTKEIEDALLRNEIDVAVHSMKDLPTTSPEGLCITAVSYRENPADWLVIRSAQVDKQQDLWLPEGAVVGTSSARRKAQILDFRSDLTIKDIRGNVPTRLNKLREGQFDAILLAAAGMTRLEIEAEGLEILKFNPKEFIPAPAQGVLAWQTREDDKATRRLLIPIHQRDTAELTNIERKVLSLLDGGCQMPVGVYCEKDVAGNYHVWAALADAWDAPLRRAQLSQSTKHQLAERIVAALKP